jgi:hypothetical protein
VEKHTATAEEEEKARKRQQWPVFDTPTSEEISAIADLRGLSIEGVSLAAERGLLYCADFREGRAYIITDSRRRNAQARRMDGKPWERIGAKAWTLPGSEAAWPIGLREASSLSAIALVEGGPDLLSAFHLAVACGVEDRIAPVAMLGANHFVPAKALSLFAKKRVRIFLHADEPGLCAARHWARQLRQVAGKVDGFGFDSGDLNDFARTHPRGEEIFSSFVAVNVAEPTVDMEEARRIAGELVRMHRAGALSGANDPEAEFFACFIHKFGATFGGVSRAA